jgi:hypothetical protein
VTVEQRDRQAPASRDRADAFADGLANFDPDARAVGVWPERTLREWTTTLVDEMQRRYEWSAEAVAVYGSDTLVDKLEAVMKDGVITFFRLVATERGTYGAPESEAKRFIALVADARDALESDEARVTKRMR